MKYGIKTKRIWDVNIGNNRKKEDQLFTHFENYTKIFNTLADIEFEQAINGPAKPKLDEKAEAQKILFIHSYIRVVEIAEEYIRITIKREKGK